MVRCHGQPVDRPPPSVPAGNDCSPEIITDLGDEKSAGIEGNQLLEAPEAIRVARFRLRHPPQPEDRMKVQRLQTGSSLASADCRNLVRPCACVQRPVAPKEGPYCRTMSVRANSITFVAAPNNDHENVNY